MRWLGFLILVPALLLIAGTSGAQTPTEEIAVAPSPHPTAAVGLVLRGGRGICTGTLIRADVVVTAAHCVQAAKSSDNPSALAFRTGAYPGSEPVEVSAIDIVMHPLFAFAQGVERTTGYDLAVIRLSKEIAPHTATPIAVTKDAITVPRLLVASFRGGRGERARERTCPVIEASDRMILMGCDVRSGESGSPVLQRTETGIAIVGVLSARGEDGPQKLAFAAGALRVGQVIALMGP